MNSPIELHEDEWKWEVRRVHPMGNGPPLFEGECQSYTACLMTFKMLGMYMRQAGGRDRWFHCERQVFIQFWRVSDGKQMQDWGGSGFTEFPPG